MSGIRTKETCWPNIKTQKPNAPLTGSFTTVTTGESSEICVSEEFAPLVVSGLVPNKSDWSGRLFTLDGATTASAVRYAGPSRCWVRMSTVISVDSIRPIGADEPYRYYRYQVRINGKQLPDGGEMVFSDSFAGNHVAHLDNCFMVCPGDEIDVYVAVKNGPSLTAAILSKSSVISILETVK